MNGKGWDPVGPIGGLGALQLDPFWGTLCITVGPIVDPVHSIQWDPIGKPPTPPAAIARGRSEKLAELANAMFQNF